MRLFGTPALLGFQELTDEGDEDARLETLREKGLRALLVRLEETTEETTEHSYWIVG